MADKPAIKSMTYEQAVDYKKELKRQGKTESTSKEFGKLVDYIKTLRPEKYGDDTVQSAYEKLSSGVTERGGWTEQNLPELQRRGISTMLDPVGGAGAGGDFDLGGYLDSFQEGAYGAAGSPQLREQIISQLEPEGIQQPELLDRTAEFEKLREQYGVAEAEGLLNELKASREEIYATDRARRFDAEGKPVALGVIGGRVSEIERQTAERVDAINRQINTVQDQLQTSYATIEMYMNFQEMDYQDAASRYNEEYNRNLQVYKLVDEEMDEREATARANLQTYANAITSGNLSYNNLSSSQKLQLNKLEVQAGMPMGFVSSLRLNPKDSIIATSSDKTQVTIIDENGNMRTIPTGISPKATGGSGGSGGETISTYNYLMEEAIKQAIKETKEMNIEFADGGEYITTNQAKPLIAAWKEQTGRSESDWWSRFGEYVFGGQP